MSALGLLPRRPKGWVIGLAAAAAAADITACAAWAAESRAVTGPVTPGRMAILTGVLALSVAAVTAAARRGRHAGWFHPLSLPLAVITVMSLGSVAWVYLSHDPAGLIYDPGHEPAGAGALAVAVSPAACEALALVVLGYLAGAGVSLALIRQRAPADTQAFRHAAVRRAGLALMAGGTLARLGAAWLGRGSAYGAAQLTYGGASVLAAASSAVLLAGLVLAVIIAPRARQARGVRGVLGGGEWAALAGYLAAVAVSGERAGLIAPMVILAWAYSMRVRPLPARYVAVLAGCALAVAAVIAGYRGAAGGPGLSPSGVVQGAAGDVSSPAWLTQQTVAAVPYAQPYLHGSTYLAAAEAQIPGPLARKTGATSRTASAVFRDVIEFRNPDQGFGESLPSEAYLNFGLPGCLGAGVLLGLLMGWAWRRRQDIPSRALGVLYPVLVAGLTYGYRSDALTQVKEVLYPMLAVWAVMAWCRVRPRGTPPAR